MRSGSLSGVRSAGSELATHLSARACRQSCARDRAAWAASRSRCRSSTGVEPRGGSLEYVNEILMDDDLMGAWSWVFGVGDTVTGWGRIFVEAEAVWFDPPQTVSIAEFGDWRRSDLAIRLYGADVSAVPPNFGPGNAIPGCATVVGIWTDHGIEEARLSPDGPAKECPDRRSVPCSPPAEGWPHGNPGQTPTVDLGLLRSSAAVSVCWRWARDTQPVLVVAASDAAAVEAHLPPQLGPRLCVVASRWTRAQLDEAREYASDHWTEWAIDRITEPCDDDAQARIEIHLFRMLPDAANWADSIESGLVVFDPALRPG